MKEATDKILGMQHVKESKVCDCKPAKLLDF